MKPSHLVTIAVVLMLITGTVIFWYAKFSSEQADKGYSFSDKVVLAYYYIWFEKEGFEGNWGSAGDALKDIHPILGPYNSWDPLIIENHVMMAKRAKIDAFAVSWWFSLHENGMNATLDLVFQKAALHDLKVCIDLEAENRPMTEISNSLRYYLTKYRNHPAVLKVEGKPVVLIWGTWGYFPENWQETFNMLEAEGLSAFYLVSGQTGPRYLGPFKCLEEYTLVDIKDNQLSSHNQELRGRVENYNNHYPESPAQWHATIMPGFDERHIPGRDVPPGSAGWKERDNGNYYRMTFEAALASNPNWIHITSFNELAEHSHIEPMQEFGWTYIDMTANFVDQFKQKDNNV